MNVQKSTHVSQCSDPMFVRFCPPSHFIKMLQNIKRSYLLLITSLPLAKIVCNSAHKHVIHNILSNFRHTALNLTNKMCHVWIQPDIHIHTRAFFSQNSSAKDKIFHQYNHFQSCDSLPEQRDQVSYLLGDVFVNIILLTAPHFLSSSNEVPSIKAHNPHFPPELLNGQPRAVFALWCECVQLNVKPCSERILMCAYQNCSSPRKQILVCMHLPKHEKKHNTIKFKKIYFHISFARFATKNFLKLITQLLPLKDFSEQSLHQFTNFTWVTHHNLPGQTHTQTHTSENIYKHKSAHNESSIRAHIWMFSLACLICPSYQFVGRWLRD